MNPAYTNLEFVGRAREELRSGTRHNKTSLEKIAARYGITDQNVVKEHVELAIVEEARNAARTNFSHADAFLEITGIYKRQVNLSHRTSLSTMLQQYSTPAPIAYLMGTFCRIDRPGQYLEPSAGNGMLTIAGMQGDFWVNEADHQRRANLRVQGFGNVTALDSSLPLPEEMLGQFDAVLANPPFGKIPATHQYGARVADLDHLMAMHALQAMKPEGRAAIIIGGHSQYNEAGRLRKGKNRYFLSWLHRHYNVADVIPIDGGALYSRMGTSFDVRLILIDGKKEKPDGTAPPDDGTSAVTTFPALFARVMHATGNPARPAMNETTANPRSQNPAKDGQITFTDNGLGWGMQAWKGDNGGVPTPETSYHSRLTVPYGLLGETVSKLKYLGATIKFIGAGKREITRELALMEDEAARNLLSLQGYGGTLEGPYRPTAQVCRPLDTRVPDSMDFEVHEAMRKVREGAGMPLEDYVREKLSYATPAQVCDAFSAEQVDAVALAIYNTEQRGVGMVVGDQTGIGKGRIAAGLIRYAVMRGLKPIFLTEKANLFSDLYRDLKAIGSPGLRPLIINAREDKSDIKDEDGEVIFRAPSAEAQKAIFLSQAIPDNYDFVMATYSQFSKIPSDGSAARPQDMVKPNFLTAIAEGSFIVMDESHNASGLSNTGNFLRKVVSSAGGVLFLSATFAKRPDNLPVYAAKTSISDANLTDQNLVNAITRGGVALQEVISSLLVAEGQMIRRERSYEGIEVNYIYLDRGAERFGLPDLEQRHRDAADAITDVMRDIASLQMLGISPIIEARSKLLENHNEELRARGGTANAGIDNAPYFSKIFQIIHQMLFAIKAEACASHAIRRLREGKKPVIAFSSTLQSFYDDLETVDGGGLALGKRVRADFISILRRGLDTVFKVTETDDMGNRTYYSLGEEELAPEHRQLHDSIRKRIRTIASGLTLSPIDLIKQRIQEAGYSVAEVTGRSLAIELDLGSLDPVPRVGPDGNLYTPPVTGTLVKRPKENTFDSFRRFNNNEVDVLMINQSGSTGASAHAIPTDSVPQDEVRQRVMIVLQAELDINTEVQKRGRINRTGQVRKPIYDYLISAIPAEKRLMMMLQSKLKSLDANTSSNQKQSEAILSTDDFLNKYGDLMVSRYLFENISMNFLLGDPLGLDGTQEEGEEDGEGKGPMFTRNPRREMKQDFAHFVSGRVAILSTHDQEQFYTEVTNAYKAHVQEEKEQGTYDLELEHVDLRATEKDNAIQRVGKDPGSVFGDDTFLTRYEVANLSKPYTARKVRELVAGTLGESTPERYRDDFVQWYTANADSELMRKLERNATRHERKLAALNDAVQRASGDELDELLDAMEAAKQHFSGEHLAADEKDRDTHTRRTEPILQVLRYFHPGKAVRIPGPTGENDIGIFIGFQAEREKNLIAPYSIKARFAVASARMYVSHNLAPSGLNQLMGIIGATTAMMQGSSMDYLQNWDSYTVAASADWTERWIVTGNLLQGYGDHRGQLISFTLRDGGTRKGIMLPPGYSPDKNKSRTVAMPIGRAQDYILDKMEGGMVTTEGGMEIRGDGDGSVRVIVLANGAGKKYFHHEGILGLAEGGNFHKVSNRMVARISTSQLPGLIGILQEEFSESVEIDLEYYRRYKEEFAAVSAAGKVRLPPRRADDGFAQRLRLQEMEAEALILLFMFNEAS